MAKSSKTSKKHNPSLGIIAVLIGFAVAVSVAVWSAYDIKQSSKDRVATNDELIYQLREAQTKPSKDLAAYLEELDKDSGCQEHLNIPAKHELRIEYKNYAKIKYGCGDTDATMYLYKGDNGWHGISPTNQFYGGFPLCSHVKENNIPIVLYSEGCFKPNANKNSSIAGTIVVTP